MYTEIAIDAGHGGINPDTGLYVTPGKRYIHPDGAEIFEGVVNRQIADALYDMLAEVGIKAVKVYHPWKDTPLDLRASACRDKPVICVHCNAGGGQGFEVYHYSKSTEGKRFAHAVHRWMYHTFSRFLINRGIKQNDSWLMLRGTKGPCAYVECGFMDHLPDARLLLDNSNEFARALCRAVVDFIDTAPDNNSKNGGFTMGDEKEGLVAGAKQAVSDLLASAKKNGILDVVAAELFRHIDSFIDTPEERDAMARSINKAIDVPILGEQAEYNLLRGIIDYAHKALEGRYKPLE